MDQTIRERLLRNVVSSLREFGYPEATEENIFKVDIYKAMSQAMLQKNRGWKPEVDEVIEELIKEFE